MKTQHNPQLLASGSRLGGHGKTRIATLLALSMLHAQLYAAALSIPNVPVFLGTVVPPNLMFVLDDSGSMSWTWLPDSAENFSSTSNYRFANAGGGVTVDNVNNYGSYTSTIGPSGSNRYGLFSSHCNAAYFNPSVTYTPPVDANGVQLPNATYTNAWFDGLRPALGTLNLSTNLRIRNGLNGGFYYQYTGVESDLNFTFTAAGVLQTGTAFYTQCNSTLGSNPGNPVFTFVDVNASAAAIQTNYANWFSYYRTRMLAMKSAAGRAFVNVNESFRVGFMTINTGNNASLLNIAPFTPANKTAWYNRFYGIPQTGSSTPLRTALNRIGQLYQTGAMANVAGETDPVTHECQKNYTLLSTDGKWNDGSAGVGNRDATVPALPATVSTLTVGGGWPFPIREGATAAPDTLADIAMRYWVTDLRPGLANNVPSDVADPATWQHMTTYTLGFGVKGTLAYPGALPGLTAGTTRWPTPVSDADTTIDDLWHTGINGFGGYLSAQDPNQLVLSLQDMLTNVASRVTSSSSVASNTTQLRTGARVYQARFDSGDWTGQLLSYTLDSAGAIAGTFEWDAATKLSSQAGVNTDSRVIFTRNTSTNSGVPFQWGSLSASQQDALRTPPTGGALDTAAVGQQRLEYLRGWSANEGITAGLFRDRPVGKLLGDIIESSPLFIGAPQAGYSDSQHPGYLAFRQSYISRNPVIYVGANDGMVHGFDASAQIDVNGVSVPTATSGNEVLAYVPGRLFSKLSKLTGQTYNSSHQYYVNSSPMMGDVDFSAGAGTNWHTVLVGGLAHGGQGYYALDVTNPNTFSEANAGSLALWEFTDSDDSDLGYTFNQPTIDPLRNVSGQIVQMNNNKWAVILGNGYNNTEADGHASTTGHAALYILFFSGTPGAWSQGVNYIKIDTNSGTVGSPNGLSTPRPIDENGDGKVDKIYAGDLNGNLWKFNVSAAAPASWAVDNSGSPLFVAAIGATRQPITSAPAVVRHPDGGNFVVFGTGKFIETADATGPFTTQSLYGIRDFGGTSVARANLVQQSILSTVAGTQIDPVTGLPVDSGMVFRSGTNNAVNYAGGDKGWYMNLPVATGESMPFNPLTTSGLVLFSTVAPSSNPCAFGGESFVMALDIYTGTAGGYGSFDADNDGSYSTTESVTNGGVAQTSSIIGVRSSVGITPTPNVIGGADGGAGGAGASPAVSRFSAYGSATNSTGTSLLDLNGTGGFAQVPLSEALKATGRVLWKEIVQ